MFGWLWGEHWKRRYLVADQERLQALAKAEELRQELRLRRDELRLLHKEMAELKGAPR